MTPSKKALHFHEPLPIKSAVKQISWYSYHQYNIRSKRLGKAQQ